MTEKNANVIMDFMKYIKSADIENFIRGMLYCFSVLTIKAALLINFRRRKGGCEAALLIMAGHSAK